MNGRIQTTTVLVRNEDPDYENLAEYVAKKKRLNTATIQVEDWDYVHVSHYQSCTQGAAVGPLPKRDIIVKVKYRMVTPKK
mgnify:CR=1 FL=1